MPLIQVGVPKGTLCEENQAVLMKKISDSVLKSEGARIGDSDAEALVWAYCNEIPKDSCYIGGKVVDKHPIYITITAPKNAIPCNAKEVLTQEIQIAVTEAIGEFEGRLNYWLLFIDTVDDAWGAAGQLFSLSQIQSVMNIET